MYVEYSVVMKSRRSLFLPGTMSRGSICVILALAAAASSSAFVPPSPSSSTNANAAASAGAAAPVGRNDEINDLVAAMTATSADAAVEVAPPSILDDYDHRTSARLPYSPTGYSKWEWKTHHSQRNQQRANDDDAIHGTTTHAVNYLEMGDPSKPALVLVHGFGASSYHFRHNVPVLAREYHVYALDLLGFGWSDKPVMDYDASVWRDQVVDFVNEVVLKDDDEEKGRDVAIAGNSLGGYTAMFASADERIKDRVRGCILLNAAGRFRDPNEPSGEVEAPEPNPIVQTISTAFQRFVIYFSFIVTKQPMRIEQILKQVYPIDAGNVDAELVESIFTPALAESAAEVFYRVISKNGSGPQWYVDDILKTLECPLLLAWGESDPWIVSARADQMEMLHAKFHGDNVGGENGSRWIKRVSIDAGHCPHDEAPEAVNDAILGFMEEVMSA